VVTARQTLAIPDQVLATKDGKKVVVKTLVVYKIRDVVHAIGRVNWDVDTTINDLTQSAVVRVVATHTYEEIMKAIADESMTTVLTKEVRKELRPFGVHIVRSKLVDFAECKVFKLMTSQADKAGWPTRSSISNRPHEAPVAAVRHDESVFRIGIHPRIAGSAASIFSFGTPLVRRSRDGIIGITFPAFVIHLGVLAPASCFLLCC